MAKPIHIHVHDNRAHDYGVPGMKKGQRKSGAPSFPMSPDQFHTHMTGQGYTKAGSTPYSARTPKSEPTYFKAHPQGGQHVVAGFIPRGKQAVESASPHHAKEGGYSKQRKEAAWPGGGTTRGGSRTGPDVY